MSPRNIAVVEASVGAAGYERRLREVPLWPLLCFWLPGVVLERLGLFWLFGGVRPPTPAHEIVRALAWSSVLLAYTWAVLPREGFTLGRIFGKSPDREGYRLALGVAVAQLGLASGHWALTCLVSGEAALPTPLAVFAADLSPSNVAGMLLVGAVVMPLALELGRWLVFRRLRASSHLVTAAAGAVGVSMFFRQDLFVSALMGLVLVLLYTCSRTIWTAIAAHALSNGLLIAASIIAGLVVDAEGGAPPGLLAAAGGLALAAFALVPWLWRFIIEASGTLTAALPPDEPQTTTSS